MGKKFKMNEVIKKIVYAGIMAPSGDNCQPWRFEVADNEIRLFNLPERDNSLYNFRQNASMIAHGAVIENMVIAASSFGYRLQVRLFPSQKDENYIASCALVKDEAISKDFLTDFIDKRVTNRKKYNPSPLNVTQLDFLLRTNNEFTGATIEIIDEMEKVKSLAKILSNNEKLVLENRDLHHFLFNHIRWTESEERRKKDGLYIKTLELGPPQKLGFKLFRHWFLLRILNKIGASKKVASENAKIYGTSSAMIAFVIPDNKPVDFISAGRLMQRTWLKITSMDLSAQPLTGITFLWQRVLANATTAFTVEQTNLIANTYYTIKQIFGISDSGTVALVLRIGDGGRPSATSSRLDPEITIANES